MRGGKIQPHEGGDKVFGPSSSVVSQGVRDSKVVLRGCVLQDSCVPRELWSMVAAALLEARLGPFSKPHVS